MVCAVWPWLVNDFDINVRYALLVSAVCHDIGHPGMREDVKIWRLLTFGCPLHCQKQSGRMHHEGLKVSCFSEAWTMAFWLRHPMSWHCATTWLDSTFMPSVDVHCAKVFKWTRLGKVMKGRAFGKEFVDLSGSKMEGFSYRSRLDHANWDPSGSGDRDKSSRDKSSPKLRHSDSCLLLLLLAKDKSPLENMHCSKMFELVGQARCVLAVQWVVRIMRMLWDRLQKLDPKSLWTVLSCQGNIFSTLSKTQYHDVRKVCVEAILHTDNAQHFSMIKDVQMLYEAPWACRFGTWWNNLQQPHVWRLFTCHHIEGFRLCIWNHKTSVGPWAETPECQFRIGWRVFQRTVEVLEWCSGWPDSFRSCFPESHWANLLLCSRWMQIFGMHPDSSSFKRTGLKLSELAALATANLCATFLNMIHHDTSWYHNTMAWWLVAQVIHDHDSFMYIPGWAMFGTRSDWFLASPRESQAVPSSHFETWPWTPGPRRLFHIGTWENESWTLCPWELQAFG